MSLIRTYAMVNAAGVTAAAAAEHIFAAEQSMADRPLRSPSNAFPLARDVRVGEVRELHPMPEFGPQFDTRVMRLAMMAARPVRDEVKRLVMLHGADRVALILATSTGGLEESERWFAERNKSPDVGYLYYEKHLIHVAAELLNSYFELKTTPRVVSTACSSSVKIVGTALRMFDTGRADAAVLIGADSLCHTTILGFLALGAMSRNHILPFASIRDGMQLGEGAAALVLEAAKEDADRAATADTLAVLSVGETSDGYHLSAPDPEAGGAIRAIRAALASAKLGPETIDYINAHGTATVHNDAVESLAILACFGENAPPVSSTKPMTGHLLGAAGLTEVILSCEAIRRGRIPANITQVPLDASCNIPIALQPAAAKVDVALSNSFGFGGSNASVIVARAVHGQPRLTGPRSRLGQADMRILAHGFFSPVFANAAEFLNGERTATSISPPFAWVAGRTRRFLSLTTQMALEAIGRALPDGSIYSRGEVRSVFASVHGEIQTGVSFLEAMERGEALSPARFAQSVHSTSNGVFAIAAQNRQFSTMLSSGPHSLAIAFEEAAMLLDESPEPILVVTTDESVPAVFQTNDNEPPFAAAWLVGRPDHPNGTRALLDATNDVTPITERSTGMGIGVARLAHWLSGDERTGQVEISRHQGRAYSLSLERSR
jgi:3-oxoacyl-[acyl-carrier-protein] synthase I